MSMNLKLIGFFSTKKPINCKIVDFRVNSGHIYKEGDVSMN